MSAMGSDDEQRLLKDLRIVPLKTVTRYSGIGQRLIHTTLSNPNGRKTDQHESATPADNEEHK
jgi:hypothetical protein